MKDMRALMTCIAVVLLAGVSVARAGQVPGASTEADVRISHHDRIYAAEQFSNTVSVTDPVDNKLLGVIRLGDPSPANFSPLYKGQVLVHGMGYSPDCVFRSMSGHDSGPCRAGVPAHAGPRFRRMPAG